MQVMNAWFYAIFYKGKSCFYGRLAEAGGGTPSRRCYLPAYTYLLWIFAFFISLLLVLVMKRRLFVEILYYYVPESEE